MEVAKGNGAQTICLTNAMKSPIIECSDLSLYATPSEVKYFQAPLAARISQMAVIDALFVYLAQKHKKSTAASPAKCRRRVSEAQIDMTLPQAVTGDVRSAAR